MSAKIGDRIHMLGKIKKANPNERAGIIEDVLSEDPPRYAIRWDSGRLTVMAPLPGAIRIEPKKAARSQNGKTAAAKKPPAKPAAKAAAKPAAKTARASARKPAK